MQERLSQRPGAAATFAGESLAYLLSDRSRSASIYAYSRDPSTSFVGVKWTWRRSTAT
jgi:hypothetical protein